MPPDRSRPLPGCTADAAPWREPCPAAHPDRGPRIRRAPSRQLAAAVRAASVRAAWRAAPLGRLGRRRLTAGRLFAGLAPGARGFCRRLGRRRCFRLVVADHGLDRTDREYRALAATHRQSDRTDDHGFPLRGTGTRPDRCVCSTRPCGAGYSARPLYSSRSGTWKPSDDSAKTLRLADLAQCPGRTAKTPCRRAHGRWRRPLRYERV